MTIVVGGEALIDLVPHQAGELRAHAGGGPYNTARTLGRLGQDVHYLGCLSDDGFGARLRAQLRTHEQREDAVFTIGPYSFRPSAKLLQEADGKKKVRLTEKETAILKYLYRAKDHVVGRDTLLGEVWGYNAGVTTHTLETHIYRLRQKIERDPAAAEILLTERGGYRLAP